PASTRLLRAAESRRDAGVAARSHWIPAPALPALRPDLEERDLRAARDHDAGLRSQRLHPLEPSPTLRAGPGTRNLLRPPALRREHLPPRRRRASASARL